MAPDLAPVSPDEVIRAFLAKEAAAGRRPTLRGLRERFRGSYTRLTRIRREFDAENGVKQAPVPPPTDLGAVMCRLDAIETRLGRFVPPMPGHAMPDYGPPLARIESLLGQVATHRGSSGAVAELPAEFDAAVNELQVTVGELARVLHELGPGGSRQAQAYKRTPAAVSQRALKPMLAALEDIVARLDALNRALVRKRARRRGPKRKKAIRRVKRAQPRIRRTPQRRAARAGKRSVHRAPRLPRAGGPRRRARTKPAKPKRIPRKSMKRRGR